MEAVAEAVAPHLAVRALTGFHPFAVAIKLKTVLPDIPEAVFIDVSLMIVGADAEAARDGAVGKYRRNVDASAA